MTATMAPTTIPVVFELAAWAAWKPRPSEFVAARIVEPGEAELLASPFLACGVARGDRVSIAVGDRGLTVRALLSTSPVTVIRLAAGSREELTPIVMQLAGIGLSARRHRDLPVALVEVPVERALPAVLDRIEDLCHTTVAFEITCHRH